MDAPVFLPFDLPVYRGLNSNHPLLAGLVEQQYDGVKFIRAHEAPQTPLSTILRDAALLAEKIISDYPSDERVNGADLLECIFSRDLQSQQLIPRDTVSFFHTAPVHLNQSHWFLHIESISQIFAPCVRQGTPHKSPIRTLPIFKLVKSLLRSEKCLGIFTNLRSTAKQIDKVFGCPQVSRKTLHARSGPSFSQQQYRVIEDGLTKKINRPEVNILFTNSWHDDPHSFFLRGGLEVLIGFLTISESCPDLHLIMRSSLPQQVLNIFGRKIEHHPRLRFIPERQTDDQMVALFADTDIFMLDACALHSVSLQRAMHCGAVCIVSDAPGYEEYIIDGEDGIVISGRRALINRVEEDSGWVFDDYSTIWSDPFNEKRCDKVANLLQRLYHDPALRERLGSSARARTLGVNSFAAWRGCFESVLRSAIREKSASFL